MEFDIGEIAPPPLQVTCAIKFVDVLSSANNFQFSRADMPIDKFTTLGPGVVIFQPDQVNLYGCELGEDTQVGPFVEIQSGVVIGARCKISSHSFICTGVTIEDEVFIGHGVMFINDMVPRATTPSGTTKSGADWTCQPTSIGKRASIGSNATILAGITIGPEALIAAGAVVTHDVPKGALVAGNPARIIGDAQTREELESSMRNPT
jgi:UDP-2-acetamido-3-amino-2,3-dideoxy-glucuronate N-acetyltransferase